MVVAVIALIAGLVGTGYAASKITGKDIKKNSVKANRLKEKTLTGKQVKNDALGGKQIDESKLKGVDAVTLDGLAMRTFTYAADNGSSDQTVLEFGPLTLRASCTSGANNGLTVDAASATGGAHISFTSISQSGVVGGGGGNADNRANNNAYGSMPANSFLQIYSPNGTTRTTNGPVDIGFANGQIVYSVPTTGQVISIDWTWENDVSGNDCYWSGTAVGGPEVPAPLSAPASGGGSAVSAAERAAAAG